ncbi:paired mesoderm homeobox protein 1-like [Onychomys torridus]|uniref:paired mesoderm homeobox protein 1-like n=1 Tax=Onychomys torridus TaxID=38674 RepID=UPI00167F4DAB|nr:paired mesoderm homeobox protein 1-like [Onychomys torridus]
MARKYFYFDYDYYGVSFYEEEVTTESEKRVICAANSGSFDSGVIDTLNKPYFEGLQSSVDNHSYQGCDINDRQDTEQEELEVARTLEDEQPSFRIRQRPYRFTPGQLWELRAVFEETHYPDALRRKELAELINVDEQKVKDWFNNKRAKLRKNQRAIMTNTHPPPTKEDLAMKTLVESKNIIILQEQVGDGLVWSQQDFDIHAGQDIPIFPHLH